MTHDPQRRYTEDLSLDPRIDSEGREGLTGTAPADAYQASHDAEDVTVAPDHRPGEAQPRWRQDFPIDWPTDHHVSHREFTKFLVLTSCAFVAGQGWIAAQELLRKNRPAPARQRIASLADIAVGSAMMFAYPTSHDRCLLIRPDEHTLLAYSQQCTHLSCAVTPRLDEGVLYCPCHAGYFDLMTGRNIAGPPPRPLARIVLEVEDEVADGGIYAVGVEERST